MLRFLAFFWYGSFIDMFCRLYWFVLYGCYGNGSSLCVEYNLLQRCLIKICQYQRFTPRSFCPLFTGSLGDSDSVSAVTGQIAGAIYGASSIPKDWISQIEKWDPNGDIPLRAWKLFHNQAVQRPGSFGIRRSRLIKITID